MSSRDIDIDWDRVWEVLERRLNKLKHGKANRCDYITNEIMGSEEVADITRQWEASIRAGRSANYTLSHSEMGPLLNAAKYGAERFDIDMMVNDDIWPEIAQAREDDKADNELCELADEILAVLKTRGLA